MRAFRVLSGLVGEAATSGDLALARTLGRALTDLLGDGDGPEGGDVIEISSKRTSR